MALHWCWAFGQESSALLQSDMGWIWGSTSTGQGQPSTTFTYTYPGSPTRYSWSQDDGGFNNFVLPSEAFVPQGWVTTAIYAASTLRSSNIIAVRGNSSGSQIYLRANGADSVLLYVDNTFKEAFTIPLNNWVYLALQYDMSGATWEGRAWVDGTAATANYTDPKSAETTGTINSTGFVNGTRNAYFAQWAVYDDVTDSGQTPYYCTRIAPDSDTSTVGSWTPTAADNHSSTNSDPFDPLSFTGDVTPSSGDNVVTSVAALNTALGVTAGLVIGVTSHTYSSATNLQANCAVRDSAGSYAVSGNVTPDTSDTTYCTVTQPTGFTGTSTVNFKYEIV